MHSTTAMGLYPVQKRLKALDAPPDGPIQKNGNKEEKPSTNFVLSVDSFDKSEKQTSVAITRMPRRSSVVQTVRDESNKLLALSNLPGLTQFFIAKSVALKVMWLCLFIMSVCMLIRELQKSRNDYYYSPISTKYTLRTPKAMDFPNVYICMGNAINSTYIRQHPDAVQGVKYVYESVVTSDKKRRRKRGNIMPEEDTDFGRLDNMLSDDGLETYFRRIRAAETNTSIDKQTADAWRNNGDVAYEFLSQAGFRVDQTFLNCSFYGYTKRAYKCNAIVKPIIDPNYFMCYVINIPDTEKQVVAGQGLSLLIDSQVRFYPLKNDTKPTQVSGLYVSVSKHYDPTNWQKSVVQPGTFTKMDLYATNVKLLNTVSGALRQECVDDGTDIYNIFNSTYSRTACQMDCMLDAFYRHCNCVLLMDKSIVKNNIISSAPFCSFNQSVFCIKPKVTSSPKAKAEIDDCRQRCHTPCNSWRYTMRSSWSYLHAPAYRKLNIPAGDLIRLDVSFTRLEYAELVQSYSSTVTKMISNIGGQIQLWLNASLISLIQLPIIMIAIIGNRLFILYNKSRKVHG